VLEDKSKTIRVARLQAIGVGLAAVGAMLLFFGIPRIYEASKSSSWPSTEGYITHSEVGRFRSGNGRTFTINYAAIIEYQYQVGGQNYTGNRVREARDNFPFAYFANRTVNSYPVGKKVAVFYLTDSPSLAVLESGIHWADFNVIFVALVLCIAGVWMYRSLN